MKKLAIERPETWTVVEHQGKLYVRTPWFTETSRPVEYRQMFPTGIRATEYPGLVGQEVMDWEGGLFKVRETGQMISLENRGTTKSIPALDEERPIPKPKGKPNARWQYGRWV